MSEIGLEQRRLAFGRVAEQYDRARPSYPAELFECLIDGAGLERGDGVLEVGAGTGKATVALAARGLHVLALEPDPEMARLARHNCARYPHVTIEQVDLEHWRGQGERFRALLSAQAWHWVSPTDRYRLAAQAICAGGTLAASWTLPDWHANELRDPLREAYRQSAPQLSAGFPMHPASDPFDLAGDWRGEIAASAAFTSPQLHTFHWCEDYTVDAYIALLGTHQDHILLAEPQRTALMEAVARVLAQAGGAIRHRYTTILCMARRIDLQASA